MNDQAKYNALLSIDSLDANLYIKSHTARIYPDDFELVIQKSALSIQLGKASRRHYDNLYKSFSCLQNKLFEDQDMIVLKSGKGAYWVICNTETVLSSRNTFREIKERSNGNMCVIIPPFSWNESFTKIPETIPIYEYTGFHRLVIRNTKPGNERIYTSSNIRNLITS